MLHIKIGNSSVDLEENYNPLLDSGEYMNIKQLAFFKKKLSDWVNSIRSEFDQTIKNMSSVDMDVHSADEADLAGIEAEIITQLRTKDRERKLLHIIEEAILKIDSGNYGYCEETGEEIGIKRLMARPITRYCIAVQERKENEQKMNESIVYNQDTDDYSDQNDE